MQVIAGIRLTASWALQPIRTSRLMLRLRNPAEDLGPCLLVSWSKAVWKKLVSFKGKTHTFKMSNGDCVCWWWEIGAAWKWGQLQSFDHWIRLKPSCISLVGQPQLKKKSPPSVTAGEPLSAPVLKNSKNTQKTTPSCLPQPHPPRTE